MHDQLPIRCEAGIIVLAPTGRLEGEAARALARRLQDAVRVCPGRWLLDLASVTLVDSVALGAIAAFARALQQAGGQVVICAAPHNVRRAFEITRLHEALDIAGDRASALRWLAAERAA